jgi:hypothetical protein
VADTRKEGFVDRWIVYGKVDGEQLFTAKELTVDPGAKSHDQDNGAYGLICVQGLGKINGQPLNSPKLIRFHRADEDEYFCTEGRRKTRRDLRKSLVDRAARRPPLLRPGGESDAPKMGAYKALLEIAAGRVSPRYLPMRVARKQYWPFFHLGRQPQPGSAPTT